MCIKTHTGLRCVWDNTHRGCWGMKSSRWAATAVGVGGAYTNNNNNIKSIAFISNLKKKDVTGIIFDIKLEGWFFTNFDLIYYLILKKEWPRGGVGDRQGWPRMGVANCWETSSACKRLTHNVVLDKADRLAGHISIHYYFSFFLYYPHSIGFAFIIVHSPLRRVDWPLEFFYNRHPSLYYSGPFFFSWPANVSLGIHADIVGNRL